MHNKANPADAPRARADDLQRYAFLSGETIVRIINSILYYMILLCFSANSWAGINDGLVAYFPFNDNTNDEN